MESTVLISIIIATYNSAKTIGFALDSVLSQKFQDWECIVVDGASTDETIDIVSEYASKDSRFRFISEPDSGIYDAFNKGWRMAKGEWIHYLGSDDRLTLESFSALLLEMTDDIDVVSGDVWIEKIDGTIKPNYSEGFNGCHQGKIVRRSLLERMNGFNLHYKILADLDLMIRMKNGGIRVKNVRTFVAFFVMNGASQEINGEWRRYKERVKIYKENQVSIIPEIKCALIHIRIVLSVLYRQVRLKVKC